MPSEWDPYDLYLSGFRSAFLGAEAGVREVPSPRGRTAFALGLRDGETRADAPKSRRQLLALLERLAP